MSRTRRTIGVALFTMLALVGAGWALEKALTNSQTQAGAVVEPTRASETVNTPPASGSSDTSDGASAAGSNLEYDRSDLLLSQG